MTAVPQRERELVTEIREALERLGWTIQPEVYARWFLGGSDKPKRRRVDLYCRAPKEWRHYAKLPVIVIEAKDHAGLGDIRIGKEQTIAAMSAFDFQVGESANVGTGSAIIRPSAALLVTRASWTSGQHLLKEPGPEMAALAPGVCSEHLRVHALGVERDLWEHGCSVLYGPSPSFIANFAGFKQTALSMGAR